MWFEDAGEFRLWLEEHHQVATEVIVGLYKSGVKQGSLTWGEAVDQALCFGWIDSTGRRIDDERPSVRFSPRRLGSIWSNVNIAKVADLEAQGLMRPAGREAFEKRQEDRSGVYSHENPDAALNPAMGARLRSSEAAWDYFSNRAPSYRRAAIHWVNTAKKEETQLRRLEQLIECSASEIDLPQFRRR
jgi:uncharacterized protein YdeI (YjbR/CyaY-like superfamily)